jgi:hypothetical protein
MTTVTKTKYDFIDKINQKWAAEQQCFDEAKLEGKDTRTGKTVKTTWPRDKPQDQRKYETWLLKVRDPDTGEFYNQRDKDGNIIKGTGPKHLVRQIVRIRTTDGVEYLYSNGMLTGYVLGEQQTISISNPETWNRTGFLYNKQFDQKTMSMKRIISGPNSNENVYEMPFNEANLKALFAKRITPEEKQIGQKKLLSLAFSVKDERNNVVRDVRDVTGIPHKTLDLFLKPFDYLANSEHISPQQKAELRQQVIEMKLLPPEAQGQVLSEAQQTQQEGQSGKQTTRAPPGTYS